MPNGISIIFGSAMLGNLLAAFPFLSFLKQAASACEVEEALSFGKFAMQWSLSWAYDLGGEGSLKWSMVRRVTRGASSTYDSGR